ncbi:MAG: tRNA (adenosine(37)-N6)-dimethylallyltransferase MiaA [Sedimentisphaerales bacterium]|nr:tRNA (adenosine(37)-N6)-dimethylallyltransferase MiaA [Sedimentisphaerales bacterium]
MMMILILGCTATGKGRVAFELARRLAGQILSIDSMKVYRRMDIGTAKPAREHRQAVPHHLIDVREPSEPFSVGRYVELADQVIDDLQTRQIPVIAVGGTAMYIRALIEGIFEGPSADPEIRRRLGDQALQIGTDKLHGRLAERDPQAAERIHPNDLKRIVRALEVYELTGRPISSFQRHFRSGNYRHDWRIIGLRRDKEQAARRINRRVRTMIETGLVDEVRGLLAEPADLSPQAAQAVGYAEIIAHLQGKIDMEEAVERIKINTRRLAKAQRTWFRGFSDLFWHDLGPDEEPQETAESIMRHLHLA